VDNPRAQAADSPPLFAELAEDEELDESPAELDELDDESLDELDEELLDFLSPLRESFR